MLSRHTFIGPIGKNAIGKINIWLTCALGVYVYLRMQQSTSSS